MRIIESTDDFYLAVQQKKPILACFQAEWCGDCHFLRPSLSEIEKKFSGVVEFVEIDIDEIPDLARAHDVSGIPSFILFQSSREIYRFVNSRRKTKEEVIDFLEKGVALLVS